MTTNTENSTTSIKNDAIDQALIHDATSPKLLSQRTAQEWVEYWLQKEVEVTEGAEVAMHDGRSIKMSALETIHRIRQEWERRAQLEQRRRKGRANKTFGGFRVKTADMSR